MGCRKVPVALSECETSFQHFFKNCERRERQACSPSEAEAAFRSVTLKDPETARHQG
jgi:hypothetical protein